MYSKLKRIATSVPVLGIFLLAASCSIHTPWKNEPVGLEVNISFVIQNNLLFLPSVVINGHTGRFFFASATPRTVIDRSWASAAGNPGEFSLALSDKEALRFSPLILDLKNSGDGLIGADVWGTHAVTIDYSKGLLTYQKEGIHPELMTLFHYDAEPAVMVTIDGQPTTAIVDTSNPDTIVLPGHALGRGSAHVMIAGTDFGATEVRYAALRTARLGNRLLSRFLITIDYGRRQVGLWRDPRIAL